jgi:hypothetical protein
MKSTLLTNFDLQTHVMLDYPLYSMSAEFQPLDIHNLKAKHLYLMIPIRTYQGPLSTPQNIIKSCTKSYPHTVKLTN